MSEIRSADEVVHQLPQAAQFSDEFGRSMLAGTRVLYKPFHAHGDLNHPDVKYGVVTRWNKHNVFVLYDGDTRPKATSPTDLTVQVPHELP